MRAPAFARALLGLIAISGALFSADGQGHGGVTDVVELLSVASDHIVSPAPSESQLGTVKRYNRFMHGKGFHTTLETQLVGMLEPAHGVHSCELAVVELLNRAFLVDRFELNRVIGLPGSKVPPTRVFGKVDLERPEFQCESSSVVSFIPLDSKFVIHKMMDGRVVFNATYQLPLHARYPQPTMSHIRKPPEPPRIMPPAVLMRCGAGGAWQRVPLEGTPKELVWKVPSGQRLHTAMVSSITKIGKYLGLFLVLKAFVFSIAL